MNKQILYFITFLCLISTFNYSQPLWTWQNPIPQNNPLYNVKFLNQNTGFAVGAAGTIIKTINGGMSWLVLNSGSTAKLAGLSIVDDNIIFASGDNNFVKTTNGGTNWSVISINEINFDKISFLNATTGYGISVNSPGKVYKTINGGTSWNNIYYIPAQVSSLHFINPDTGFVGGGPFAIRRTTDGGSSWTTFLLGTNNQSVNSIYFVNSNTGYAGGNGGTVAKTTDCGISWVELGSFSNFSVSSIAAVDVNNVVVSGAYNNSVLKTTNGGVNWTLLSDGSLGGIKGISYPAFGIIYTVSAVGDIKKTTSGGNNWVSQNQGYYEDIRDLFFVNISTGFAVGPAGRLLKTTDGGTVWLPLNTGFTNDFYSVYFLNTNTGFLGGSQTAIFKTTNSGLNWSVSSFRPSGYISKIVFPNQNTGFASKGNILFYTTNLGNNWYQKTIPGPSTINIIYFPTPDTGFTISYSGSIYKTTDSGNSWNTLGNPYYYNAFHFINGNTGFAGAYRFDKTTNGGLTWNNVTSSFSQGFEIYRMHFLNETTGFVIGSALPHYISLIMVCKTTDGGVTWTNEFPGTISTPYSIFAINQDVCYIGGSNGTILKRTQSNLTPNLTSIITNGTGIPYKFNLYQNYPNPFNPLTKIKFDIPANVGIIPVKLVIFDILGNELSQLYNGSLKPGTYEVDFGGSSLSSGTYFYRLTAGDYIETKKMILLK